MFFEQREKELINELKKQKEHEQIRIIRSY